MNKANDEEETGSGFYYALIDERYRRPLQSTQNLAAYYAMKAIDAQEDNNERHKRT